MTLNDPCEELQSFKLFLINDVVSFPPGITCFRNKTLSTSRTFTTTLINVILDYTVTGGHKNKNIAQSMGALKICSSHEKAYEWLCAQKHKYMKQKQTKSV